MVIYYYQDSNRGIKYSIANKKWQPNFVRFTGKGVRKEKPRKGLKLQLRSCALHQIF